MLGARFAILIMLISCTCVKEAQAEQILYHTDWQDGIAPRLIVQANPGDITVVVDPKQVYRRVLKVTIDRSEDFSRIANGAPRAEILLPVRFTLGKTYHVRWATMLPMNESFDARQLVIVTQIHQGPKTGGPPPVALTMQASRYAISQRSSPKFSVGQWLCCADSDVGKWVNWELLYRPDDSGKVSLTELRRDGALVFSAAGSANAYLGDQDAYLKIGLYKPGWKLKSTDVESVSMLYGPLTISVE
jgi:hypothetical protein